MRKTKQEILDELLSRLERNTVITDINPGSVARTFAEVLTEQFYEFYSQLELNSTMSFVSTASGRYLDLVGALLDCNRLPSETDENYRARITKQVYVIAGANFTAVRLRALSVPGVRDVVMRQYTHGAGSFSVHVITDEPVAPISIINQVRSEIEKVKAYGIYAEVSSPVLIPVELMVSLVFNGEVSSAEKTTIRQAVARELRQYVDNLTLGNTLVINEIVQRIMNSSAKIKDVAIYSLKVNGTSRFVGNVETRWDERLVLDSLEII